MDTDLLQRTIDRLDIIEHINRYASTIDNADLEAFYSLFTEDCVWAQTVPTRSEPIEYLSPRSKLEERFNAIFLSPEYKQLPAGVNSFHVQTGTVFAELATDYAKATTQAVIFGQMFNDDGDAIDGATWRTKNEVTTQFVGVYHDVLVKLDGRWLFKERIFHASNEGS